jgi:hypothetical protein
VNLATNLNSRKIIMKLKIPTKSTYFSSSSLSTVDMLKKIIEFTNLVAGLVGCDIFKLNFSLKTLKFGFWMGHLITYIFFLFHNIYLYRSDLARICFCMVTFAACVQGIAKIYTFVANRDKIMDMIYRLEKFHNEFQHQKNE